MFSRENGEKSTRYTLSTIERLMLEQKLPPFTVENFLELALEIIDKTTRKHARKTAYALFSTGIKISFNSGDNRYVELSTHRQDQLSKADYTYKDRLQLSLVLEQMQAITNFNSSDKRENIILYILNNELQAFRLRCHHYQNQNTAQALNTLYHAFIAVQKLLESPISKATALVDLNLMWASGKLPQILGDFIQENGGLQTFNEVLSSFLVRRTTTHDSFSQSIIRSAQAKDANEAMVDPNELQEENLDELREKASSETNTNSSQHGSSNEVPIVMSQRCLPSFFRNPFRTASSKVAPLPSCGH